MVGLFEYAWERRTFSKKLNDIVYKLADHVLLVSDAYLEERNKEYFTHWKKEILSFIVPLCVEEIKVRNIERVKERCINQNWIDGCEIFSHKFIISRIDLIDFNKNIQIEYSQNLAVQYGEIMNIIIDSIVHSNYNILKKYLIELNF